MHMHQETIGLRRLVSQQIARPASADPAEAVRRMGAVQAQDYLGALWAVGLRTTGATERTVEQALAERRIVRTWPMRGTIHLVAAADVRWMLELMAPRAAQRGEGRLRQLGIDAATLAAGARATAGALAGGRQLTRAALLGALDAAGIATDGQRGYHILIRLAHERLICFGARAGKQPTFVLLDEWAPGAPALPRDEALATLALRYFTGHGPATVHDLAWWSGLTIADVRAGLAAAAPQLASATIAGQDYYFADGPAAAGGAEGQAFLLPPFDEFLIAYRDRSAALDPAHSGLVAPGSNGVFNPIVVIGGRVIGTWRRTLKAKSVALAAYPFAAWGDAQAQALPAAFERYRRFLGLPAADESQGGG